MTQYPGPSAVGRPDHLHDDYPIHLINQVQPHGLLLVLSGAELYVQRVSQNSLVYWGLPPEALLNRSLFEVLPNQTVTELQQAIARYRSHCCAHRSVYSQRSAATGPSLPPIHVPIAIAITQESQTLEKTFDGFVHTVNSSANSSTGSSAESFGDINPSDSFLDELVILEVEPTVETSLPESSLPLILARLSAVADIRLFLQTTAEALKSLTGYDRVMVYQFDEGQAGEVVAEAKPPEAVSYLGLHYPATDIPKRVRSLYQAGLLRVVPDLAAEPVPLVHALSETDAQVQPVDLSQSILRGVDPCCVTYHQNMGVAALTVIALEKEGQLWGLIACHHTQPKRLPYPERAACEVLGRFVAAALSSRVNEEEIAYLTQLKAIQSKFIADIAEAQDFKQALIHPEPRLLDLVNATGAAVCLDTDLTLVGKAPPAAFVNQLIDWTVAEHSHNLFHTGQLSAVYPDAAAYTDIASGALVLVISRLRRYVIVWFRPEVLQTVNWAGNPEDAIRQASDGTLLLCPRNSFEQWQETVRATSQPWKAAEVESALDLRSAIIGIVLNKADELAQVNLELSRSNRELDSFAYAASHDLKEPLRGITNFANILVRRHSQDLDETGIKRLQTLVRLAQRMDSLIDALLQFSRLGQAELNCQMIDMSKLVQRAIDDLSTGRDRQNLSQIVEIEPNLPTVNCDPALVRNVFINLVSNALKYIDNPSPHIKIGALEQTPPAFYVQDNGIGISARHFQTIFRLFKRLHSRESYGGGNGIGLSVTQKIVERHGGRIWLESELSKGSTFYFTLENE